MQTPAAKPGPTHKLIQGDTFRVKDRLKELGGVWDAQLKGWWLPETTYDEARLLVDNCPGQMGFDDL